MAAFRQKVGNVAEDVETPNGQKMGHGNAPRERTPNRKRKQVGGEKGCGTVSRHKTVFAGVVGEYV